MFPRALELEDLFGIESRRKREGVKIEFAVKEGGFIWMIGDDFPILNVLMQYRDQLFATDNSKGSIPCLSRNTPESNNCHSSELEIYHAKKYMVIDGCRVSEGTKISDLYI